MVKRRFSKQRESIRAYLEGRKDHPTAEMIYEAVREEFPSISLGTVYRNLALLEEDGEIVRLDVGEEQDRFDPNIEKHYHFVCRKCGAVSDLDMPWMTHVDVLAESFTDGKIEGHSACFYGLCEKCIMRMIPD